MELWVDHEGYEARDAMRAEPLRNMVAFMVNPQFHMTAAWRRNSGGASGRSFGGRNTVIEG